MGYTNKAVVVDPRPKYREEVYTPGRQGIRAKRDSNPACGSANLLGTTHHGFPDPLPPRPLLFLFGVSRRSGGGGCPGRPGAPVAPRENCGSEATRRAVRLRVCKLRGKACPDTPPPVSSPARPPHHGG